MILIIEGKAFKAKFSHFQHPSNFISWTQPSYGPIYISYLYLNQWFPINSFLFDSLFQDRVNKLPWIIQNENCDKWKKNFPGFKIIVVLRKRAKNWMIDNNSNNNNQNEVSPKIDIKLRKVELFTLAAHILEFSDS